VSAGTTAPPEVIDVQTPAALRRGRLRRQVLVLALAGGAMLMLAVIALMMGAAGLTPGDVVAALTGTADASDTLVVRRLRLPRVLAAVAAGCAFGTAGALFQSTLRNALASPDILGISAGASLGAVWGLLVLGLSGAAVVGLAGLGAAVAAAAIWLLAWRQGLHGIRFVLVGIGFAYLASSTIGWLLTRAEVREAAEALLWTVGSVGDVSGDRLVLLLVAVGVLVPFGLREHGRQRVLALGDDHARGLGVATGRSRTMALLVGVALVAAATSVAGPVPFVALAAPAIARSLLDDGGPALALSGVLGALLMLGADVVGQHALPGQLAAPVGIVTGLVGAPYLIWLLARTSR
jgi:iron complex transport system permease protein